MSVTIERIKFLLKSDFENKLFEACLNNLEDLSNELRYHNFCYSIRELSRHFLHSLSPSESVFNCSWFKVETENGLPSRTQRIKYAIQGGLADKTLASLDFDLDLLKETIKEIKSIIDSLSNYTHINPENFELTDSEINSKSKKVLETFELLVETINKYREDLKQFLDGIIEEDMIDSIISNSYQNVDMLAPHFSIDYGDVEEYYIEEITDTEIIVVVNGNLNVILEYGSRNERKNDDGLDLHESFPFETKIRYSIEEGFPTSSFEVDDFDVDTSSWYGDDEIDNFIDEK
jgi:Asp-tRNA(Asn)/Glu-tRNA(Gln) amidotransferase C subunit